MYGIDGMKRKKTKEEFSPQRTQRTQRKKQKRKGILFNIDYMINGGETPMLCVMMILSQSIKLHTSPVWPGA
jgi:hypothetical protein